ncbi:MAG: hypothetical protein GDA53_11790 [Rhodobacteraceae bacterium]|nr:hypothetical protein [Paracoccaceae bacterium]
MTMDSALGLGTGIIRAPGGKPIIFSAFHDSLVFHFEKIPEPKVLFLLRIFNEEQRDLNAVVTYRTAAGTPIHCLETVLEYVGTASSRLREEHKINNLVPGHPKRYRMKLSPPKDAATVTIVLKNGGGVATAVVQSARLCSAMNTDDNTRHTYASRIYLGLHAGYSERIVVRFKKPPAKDIRLIDILMPDVVGNGPGVLRMKRYSAKGDLIVPGPSEILGHDGSSLGAIPRARKLEKPHLSPTRFFLSHDNLPNMLACDIELLGLGTNGFIDLSFIVFRMHRNVPEFDNQCPALDDISLSIYRNAHEAGTSDLINLLV